MNLTEYLSAEWRPALGCTEPAAVAYAACLAAGQAGGSPRSVQLVLDARTYKNCHAVGIPNSGHQSGVLWALALGAVLPDPSPALQIFESVTPEARAQAARLLALEALQVEVDATRTELYISCTVGGAAGVGRAVLTAVIEACEHLGVRQLMAVIGDSENFGSVGLHARCGFSHQGVLTGVGLKFGRWLDVVLMERGLGVDFDTPQQ